MIRNFTELDAWKKARQLKKDISKLTKGLPAEEKYRLVDQIIRSSRSIGNNIAEGHGRFHYVDSKKFYINARGSASETIDHLIIALDEGFITEETFKQFERLCEECLKLINGYINYLKQQSEAKSPTG